MSEPGLDWLSGVPGNGRWAHTHFGPAELWTGTVNVALLHSCGGLFLYSHERPPLTAGNNITTFLLGGMLSPSRKACQGHHFAARRPLDRADTPTPFVNRRTHGRSYQCTMKWIWVSISPISTQFRKIILKLWSSLEWRTCTQTTTTHRGSCVPDPGIWTLNLPQSTICEVWGENINTRLGSQTLFWPRMKRFSLGFASSLTTPGYSVSPPTGRTCYFQLRSPTSDPTSPSVPSHGEEHTDGWLSKRGSRAEKKNRKKKLEREYIHILLHYLTEDGLFVRFQEPWHRLAAGWQIRSHPVYYARLAVVSL